LRLDIFFHAAARSIQPRLASAIFFLSRNSRETVLSDVPWLHPSPFAQQAEPVPRHLKALTAARPGEIRGKESGENIRRSSS